MTTHDNFRTYFQSRRAEEARSLKQCILFVEKLPDALGKQMALHVQPIHRPAKTFIGTTAVEGTDLVHVKDEGREPLRHKYGLRLQFSVPYDYTDPTGGTRTVTTDVAVNIWLARGAAGVEVSLTGGDWLTVDLDQQEDVQKLAALFNVPLCGALESKVHEDPNKPRRG